MTTTSELLAAYWLKSSPVPLSDPLTDLWDFAGKHKIPVTDEILAEAAQLIGDGEIDHWVITLNFMGHPNANWNFLIDAVAAAETDADLERIAAGTAEHLLAHYGSLISLFERHAECDPRFARMLTGVWRHRMCDDVWARVRSIQQAVPDQLNNMQPFDAKLDALLAEKLTPEDRDTPDKGVFRRIGPDWVRGPA